MALSSQKHYEALKELGKRMALLNGIHYLLEWDQETYMPPGSHLNRADQIELISSLLHEEKTSKNFASQLSKLIDLDTGKVLSRVP